MVQAGVCVCVCGEGPGSAPAGPLSRRTQRDVRVQLNGEFELQGVLWHCARCVMANALCDNLPNCSLLEVVLKLVLGVHLGVCLGICLFGGYAGVGLG